MDATSIIASTTRELKTAMYQINRLVQKEDQFHKLFLEGLPNDIEVLEGMNINAKIRLKGK